MADRFYTNCPLQPGEFVLRGSEAHHLSGVRRFRPNDEIQLINGDGHEYPARVLSVTKRAVVLTILSKQEVVRELPFGVETAAPLPKGDRAQFLLEKLTELGVQSFVPLLTERALVKPKSVDKLRRYVVEASKQCGRNVLMNVDEMVEWRDYCTNVKGEKRYIAHPGSDQKVSRCRFEVSAGQKICTAVGPEGGFTTDEINLATENGWQTVDLGPRILRIETAALLLAAQAQMEHG